MGSNDHRYLLDALAAIDPATLDYSHEPSPMGQENEIGITNELRECVETATKTYEGLWYEMNDVDHTICHITEGELLGIADRIDEQFDRICTQQEDVLQQTIDGMVNDRDSDQLRIEKLEKQRDGFKRAMCAAQDLLEKRTTECDELRERLDRVADALRGVERGTMSAWEAADEVGR